ncbi:hypothetical protein [Streptomyces cahuitamycinicus]|uniref:Uncharacterized protein n=1 Tax=Streptomyces cahuitamycinicus TaxID=2070367 RepID=A0A2N8TS99_9ACTN|nr:hypothetical protein [Streptomyces cahuitamycinicus]PNG21875.1 hypothetical protein C1J00_12515 [Streptomyces cahuitamycinicus]
MKPVFPYPTLLGDVGCEVVSVSIDGKPLPYTNVSATERVVALHQSGRAGWEEATLNVRATLPESELSDGPWQDVICLATLTEKATNARTTARLRPASDGSRTGSIILSRALHLRRATLSLLVIATVNSVAGRLVGSAEQDWYVDLQEATPVRQREIDIVEIDFRDGPHDGLRPYKESSWIIETSGDMPIVYLNTTAVEGLMEVLGSRGGNPTEKVLREMAASQVAQDAWTAMFHTAISDLDTDEDGTPVMPTGWRESVLRQMLPDVLPGRQLTDALYEINERRTKGFGWSELQTGIQYAAGRRAQISKKLATAVRTIDRTERNTD